MRHDRSWITHAQGQEPDANPVLGHSCCPAVSVKSALWEYGGHMFVIGSVLGWAAVVLTILLVIRGAQGWRTLAYLLADSLVDIAELLDRQIGLRLYQAKRYTAEMRFWKLLYNPLFQLAWNIEQFVRNHSLIRRPFGNGYAAASPVSSPRDGWFGTDYDDDYDDYDEKYDLDDDYDYLHEEPRSVDDYRYNY